MCESATRWGIYSHLRESLAWSCRERLYLGLSFPAVAFFWRSVLCSCRRECLRICFKFAGYFAPQSDAIHKQDLTLHKQIHPPPLQCSVQLFGSRNGSQTSLVLTLYLCNCLAQAEYGEYISCRTSALSKAL